MTWLALLWSCTGETEKTEPVVLPIAVLLPQTDELPPALEWARDNINESSSYTLELHPLAYQTTTELGQHVDAILTEQQYVATVGAMTSASLFEVADSFLLAQQPLLSFNSNASELFRAYGGKSVLWRTQQSDIGQTELLLHHARQSGAKNIMLLAGDGVDSSGFFDWFGFFAAEVNTFDTYSQHLIAAGTSCTDDVLGLVASSPDMVFVAVDSVAMIDCIVDAYALSRVDGAVPFKLVMVDTGFSLQHLQQQGARAFGIRGFASAPDPENGFESAFLTRSGRSELPVAAANAYDSLLLLGYGLEVSKGQGGEPLLTALADVVSYDGENVGWNEQGISQGMTAIRQGENPDISGATGDLDFDDQLGMDLASSYYAHWLYNADGITLVRSYFTGDFDSRPLQPAGSNPALGAPSSDIPEPGPPGERWVVIASGSQGWSNYRHMADALAHYQYFKSVGFSDDRIILIGDADLVSSSQNPEPGVIRNVSDGNNLNQNVEWDYTTLPSAQGLLDIITGTATTDTPIVVERHRQNSIFVYLVGHGSENGLLLGAETAGQASQTGNQHTTQTLTPDALRQSLCMLQEEDAYRHIVMSIDSCASGAMGDAAFDGLEKGCGESSLYHVLLLSSASPSENSLSTNYDENLGLWRSNEYSWRFILQLQADPEQSIYDLYSNLYVGVSGSHVSLYNHQYYGAIQQLDLGLFFQ